MKKQKILLLASVLAALLMPMPACKALLQDDNIEFVSLTATLVPQYDEYGEVIFVAAVRVKAYADTTIIMKYHLNYLERVRTEPVADSNGQWLDIELSAAELVPITGRYEVKVDCTLISTGKTVSGTTTIVVN